MIVEAAFSDIHLRDPYNTKCPYIPLAKVKREHAKTGIYDNGRIIEQPGIMIYAFLGVEWDVICRQYAGGIQVIRAYYAPKDFLPDEFRQNCYYWYEQKTTLKGVSGKEYEYMKSKNRVNSSFGMCVEHIVKDINELQPDFTFKTRRPTLEEAEKQLSDFYTPMKQKFLAFQWGITVTALARVEHMKLIDLVGEDFVYGDTDSVFYLHPEDHETDILKYNETWKRYAAACGCPYSAYTKKGELQILGVADREPDVKRFVTLGAKKYAMEIDGKLDITIAGVPKKQGSKLLRRLENFRPGYLFYIDDSGSLEERQSWKKILHYHDNKPFTIRIGDHDLRIGTGIGITRAPYKLDITEEYKLLTGYTEIYTEDDVWE